MSSSRVHVLTMPKWGLSMREGKIVGWLASEGSEVAPGSEVVEVETDKMLSAIEASHAGRLRRQVGRPGEVVPVGGIVGVISDDSISDAEIDAFIADFRSGFKPEDEVQQASSEPHPQVITVQGQNVRFLQRGGGGLPALLIHGFGADLNNWLFNHEFLAEKRAVYAIDLPGHGGSSKQVVNPTLEGFVGTVEAFLNAIHVTQAHLVGHSMGAVIALQFALAHPDRVASLVLIASAGLGNEINAAYIEGFTSALRVKELKPHLEELYVNPKSVTRRMIDEVLKYKRLDGVEQALRAIAAQFFPAGRQAMVLRDRLAELTIPVLVVWGAEDRILSTSHARGLPTGIRTEVIPSTGHMVHMEAATEVNRLIDSFWTR
jgi:pyruvate dehydrogenase E2 component (dihydrolipoamide acetyltransferase)